MHWQPWVFGFVALAFAIRALRHDGPSAASWIAAAAFAALAVVWILRGPKP